MFRTRPRGLLVALLGVLVAVVLAVPRVVPNAVGNLGSLAETVRPWLLLTVPVLALLAWWRRSRVAGVAALLPAVAWAAVFGGALVPRAEPPHHLLVVQHNVSDVNPDPAAAGRALRATGADLVALEEVVPASLPAYSAAFGGDYPHHTGQGTVALWSRHPLAEARLVDLRPAGVGPDWNRGLRAVARTPRGDVAVYVAHLPSVRFGPGGFGTGRRDESAARLGAVLAAEPLPRVLLLGDLNGTVDDRGLRPVSRQLRTAGEGFAFSWPAAAPVARIDQVMARGITVTEVRALPSTGSDHLPIAARLRVG